MGHYACHTSGVGCVGVRILAKIGEAGRTLTRKWPNSSIMKTVLQKIRLSRLHGSSMIR